MKTKEGIEAAAVARARVIAKHITEISRMFRQSLRMYAGHTGIPIHQFIRQLPISLPRLQLPLLKWIPPTSDLCTTKCPPQAADRAFLPLQYAFVVCLEQYAHGMDNAVGIFE